MRDLAAAIVVFSGAVCVSIGGLGKRDEFSAFIGTVVMAVGLLAWLGWIPTRKRLE